MFSFLESFLEFCDENDKEDEKKCLEKKLQQNITDIEFTRKLNKKGEESPRFQS